MSEPVPLANKPMSKEDMTDLIISAKKAKGLTWGAIANELNLGKTWIASACLGMNSVPEEIAKSLCDLLELDDNVCKHYKSIHIKNGLKQFHKIRLSIGFMK